MLLYNILMSYVVGVGMLFGVVEICVIIVVVINNYVYGYLGVCFDVVE